MIDFQTRSMDENLSSSTPKNSPKILKTDKSWNPLSQRWATTQKLEHYHIFAKPKD